MRQVLNSSDKIMPGKCRIQEMTRTKSFELFGPGETNGKADQNH